MQNIGQLPVAAARELGLLEQPCSNNVPRISDVVEQSIPEVVAQAEDRPVQVSCASNIVISHACLDGERIH
jgi:hypothetical protein